MEQTNNAGAEAPKRPGMLSALCILSFIGSGLWALLGLIGIFASGWIMSLLGGGMAQVDTSSMSDADKAAMGAAGGMMGMLGSYLIIIMIVVLVFALLSLFGAIKMWQLKKSGFWLYLIPNAIWTVLLLIGGSWVMGIAGVAFIVLYGMNLKHMK